MNKVFKYKGKDGSEKEISIDEIQKMTMPEFLYFQDRLMKVRRRRRRDIAIFENNVKVTPQHSKEIFRKGIGEEDTYATSNTEFVKNRAHTNMLRGGHFGEGNMTIITSIEAHYTATALQATTTEHGIVLNPKGVVPTAYDPFLLGNAWLTQTELVFRRGETIIVDGLLEDFPQMSGLSGVAGASVGALVQNAFLPNNFLNQPEVLVDTEDFAIEINPLAREFDLTSASGLNIGIVQEVKLNTIELVRQY